MAIDIPEIYVKRVNSIMSKLPQNPFIVDVVGKAIQIACEEHGDNELIFNDMLDVASKVATYAAEVSSPTSFKYALIASALLINVPYEKYEIIDTASGTVKDYVEKISDFEVTKSFKEKWLILNKIAKQDTDLLYVAFCIMNHNLENILESQKLGLQDKLYITGCAYLEASLRKSAITVPNRQFEEYNHFMSILMKKAQF